MCTKHQNIGECPGLLSSTNDAHCPASLGLTCLLFSCQQINHRTGIMASHHRAQSSCWQVQAMPRPLNGAGLIQNMHHVAAGESGQNFECVHQEEGKTFQDVEAQKTEMNAHRLVCWSDHEHDWN